MDTEWMGQGRCKYIDRGVSFLNDWIGAQSSQRASAESTVRGRCLGYALTNRITDDVWGGTSERQRNHILCGRRPWMAFTQCASPDPIGRH
jgi:hypothetical protein